MVLCSPTRMNELDLIDRIRRKVGRQKSAGLLLGIGDDCAIFRPRGSREDLLFTTDLLVEDVHFDRKTHPPDAIGHKTLARGLSDIAAMGGEPRFFLLSLALPQSFDRRWIDRFYRGLLGLGHKYGSMLAGGDLSRSEKIVCDIVVCGAVPRGKALRRDAAKTGDDIYVSGCLGGSALGLARGKGRAFEKHLYPEPRIELGLFLRGKVTSAMDLSDGLSIDLLRLCRASNVAAELDSEIPRFQSATLEQALHGGEDYEILFTANTRIPADYHGLPLTRIGTIRRGPPAVKLHGRPLAPLGYDHFRDRSRSRS